MDALAPLDHWGATTAAAAVVTAGGAVAEHGPVDAVLRIASVTKLLTAYATLVAVEEGSVALDDPVGQPGATVRHLLAHAGGYGFDSRRPIMAPQRRRIYSNTGIELAGRPRRAADRHGVRHLPGRGGARAPRHGGRPSCGGRRHTSCAAPSRTSPPSPRELLRPTLVTPATLAEATTVQYPGLGGVLPGVGRFRPLDWGLGFELRDAKAPHWTGTSCSPATFGHFGGSGTFLWIDPVAATGLVVLTDREFGPWALEAWPPLSDAVLAALTP